MDSVARGVCFSQLARLGVAGRAWPSLLGVVWGDVGRARMACRRCECGRRRGCRVTQKVGVMRHSACRGNLMRQELVGMVVVWGRESRRGRNVVRIGPVAWRPAIYAFGVTLKAMAVVVGLGRALGSVRRLTGRRSPG